MGGKHKGNKSKSQMANTDGTLEGLDSMMELFKTQASLIDQIETYRRNYRKRSKDTRTKGYIQARISGINDCWRKFSENHCRIESMADAKDRRNAYFIDDKFSESEEIYANFLGELNDDLEPFLPSTTLNSPPYNTSHHQSTPLQVAKPEVKMPRIDIPKFSGSYKLWRSFRDLFVSTIHNSAISKVQKMYFLKSNLEGEAARLIRHLEATEDNYDAAWNILSERFENKRIIVNHHLQYLMSQPAVKTESHESIKQLIDVTKESLHALQNLGIDTSTWDSILIYTLIQKVSPETRELWETSLGSKIDLPTFSTFLLFLENRFRTLEMIKSHTKTTSQFETRNQSNIFKRERKAFHLQPQYGCILCKNQHTLRKCPKFLNMTAKVRLEFASRNSLCLNCLAPSHPTQGCTSPRNCYHCAQRHHTLLHDTAANNFRSPGISGSSHHTPHHNTRQSNFSPHNVTQPSTPQHTTIHNTPHHTTTNLNEKNITTLHVNQHVSSRKLLLATALITIPTETGVYTFRALVDPCSEGSFITEDAAQQLQLKRTRIQAQIKGLNLSPVSKSSSQVSFTIKSFRKGDFFLNVTALVVNTITNHLPAKLIEGSQDWPHIKNLPLADPHFTKPSKVDVLLGVEVYARILVAGLRNGPPCCPVALNTQLGWILFGELPTDISDIYELQQNAPSNVITSLHCNVETDQLLQRFWEVEEIMEPRQLSEEDVKCEQHYASTHRRDVDGRYIVHLPFKDLKPPVLGNSRELALRRLKAMERKLEKNPDIYADYTKCLQEYIELGHMKLSTTTECEHLITDPQGISGYTLNYLPHHAVFKESSTTRLRVVFDASARTSNGITLNDTLLTGPKLQEDLLDVILRWRKYPIAFTADIAKMYRQIKVIDQHIPYQRILWRNNPNETIQEYDLSTVTFGTACAPYLAMRTIKQLAYDEREAYALAHTVASRDFYVDDVMSGTYDLETGLTLQSQLNDMLASGGFELRKWVSNTPALTEHLSSEQKESTYPMSLDLDHCIKTLGICWYPIHDVFAVKISEVQNSTHLSKRSLLSQIASLFDPIGWLAPCIVLAKILMQQLWLTGVGWDDCLPAEIQKDWDKLRGELHLLKTIRIPRWIGSTTDTTSIQLHGFCDASTKAYCAVLYTRVTLRSGEVQVSLFTSKTKVAPVKPITLPRLELCAAVLLSKLLHKAKGLMCHDNLDIYTWTDSTIALSWIHERPTKWKTFVCNRVATIHAKTSIDRWRHVPSTDNPADCGSRGLLPSKFIDHHLWWHGPRWLKYPKDDWPKTFHHHTTDVETKIIKTLTTQLSPPCEQLTKYSNLSTLLRIVAWCFRFTNNCKKIKQLRQYGWLTAKEILQARTSCIKILQQEVYGAEIKNLQNSHSVNVKSRLLSLNPFLSPDGLLRVGGRLEHSDLSYNEKHPIILPNQHYFTKLVVLNAHHTTLHGGPQLMLAYLRKTFWIPNPRNLLRHVVHHCITCFKQRAAVSSQLMANLPAPRLKISRAFTHTGVDYAGPIFTRVSKGRGRQVSKGYIALFVCLCTKAIHLEAVSDLSTQAFMAALKRFTARRGLCSDLYSDCGTNFVGANRTLQEDCRKAIRSASQITAASVADYGIQWHFSPPSSPHFGGLWEAGVKSMKHHLRRVLGDTSLTFEELTTVLSQIEACLNSRPLCPMSTDSSDLSVLTPGHFLIGDSLLAPPEPDYTDTKLHLLSRWQLLQRLMHQFWKKWSQEYLARLQQRPKWTKIKDNLQIGNLVIIKDERMSPTQWPLGRILEVYPGRDGLVRVALVKTQKTTLKRPIAKLCILPIIDNYETSHNTTQLNTPK